MEQAIKLVKEQGVGMEPEHEEPEQEHEKEHVAGAQGTQPNTTEVCIQSDQGGYESLTADDENTPPIIFTTVISRSYGKPGGGKAFYYPRGISRSSDCRVEGKAFPAFLLHFLTHPS